MDKVLISAIRDWAQARTLAKENSGMILRDSSQPVMDECARRMKVLQRCEDDLCSMGVRLDLPKPLVKFLEAKADNGCMTCRISSSSLLAHPECEVKIARYFRAEDELRTFGMGLI